MRDRLQLEDLVKHDKINVERLEKKLTEIKAENEQIKIEKKKEDDRAKQMALMLDEKIKEKERIKKQNQYLNTLIIHFQREMATQA